MLKAKLVVVGGDAKAAEVQLKLPTIIGRGREAGLTVPHALVSRQHTEVFEKSGQLFVRDLGSLNGTFVNNKKIEGDQLLGPNQLLTLGNVTFRAVYEAANQPDDDTVTFDEVKTAVNFTQAKEAIDVKGEKINFEIDETVPMDSLVNGKKKVASPKVVAPKSSSPKPANPKAAELNKKKGKEGDEKEASVLETEGKSNSPTSDTDKSIIGSDMFKFETDDVDPASKSVSVSALDDLPAGTQPAVSFVGKVDFGDEAEKPASQIDPVQIDLGEEKPGEKLDADSSLGSFLKKLPR